MFFQCYRIRVWTPKNVHVQSCLMVNWTNETITQAMPSFDVAILKWHHEELNQMTSINCIVTLLIIQQNDMRMYLHPQWRSLTNTRHLWSTWRSRRPPISATSPGWRCRWKPDQHTPEWCGLSSSAQCRHPQKPKEQQRISMCTTAGLISFSIYHQYITHADVANE